MTIVACRVTKTTSSSEPDSLSELDASSEPEASSEPDGLSESDASSEPEASRARSVE